MLTIFLTFALLSFARAQVNDSLYMENVDSLNVYNLRSLDRYKKKFASLDLEKFPGDACFRECQNSKPRVCYYKWHLEHYHTMGPACKTCGQTFKGNVKDCFNEQCVTADGLERGIMSINRKVPGPSIHVCKDDHIVVDVINLMGGTSVAIHWHGFHHRKTPHFDGVPYITQCPIPFSTTFRYAFDATEAGTQFYHSHSGHHKVNGHYGGIVVRRSTKDDPNGNTYDHDERDHLLVISDWMKTDGEMFMPGLRSDPIGIQPSNLLINGKGTIRNKFSGRSETGTPLEVFRVERGQRYRFRFVNSMSHVCPAQVEIENHGLLIIASDSFDLQPVSVDSFVSNSGERYDFVVNANQSGDTFWIRVRALGACADREVEQFAILSYMPSSIDMVELAYPQKRFPDYSVKFGGSRSLNHPNTTCGNSDPENFCITDLSSYVERPDITDVPFNERYYLGFGNYAQKVDEIFKPDNYGHFMNLRGNIVTRGAINNISFHFPEVSLLTQPENVKENMFCDENSVPPSCYNKICSCVHRIKVKLNSIVELVVVDEASTINGVNHPFHLHGYQLFVMGMGQHPDKLPMTVELAKLMTEVQRLPRTKTKKYYPIKDTISIPSKGYTIFRFKADNPGFWLLHCHFEWHLAVGMGLVVQVGEAKNMVKPPKDFPKCNNYKPEINANVFS